MRSGHRDTRGPRWEELGEQLGLLDLGRCTDGKLLHLTKIRLRRKESQGSSRDLGETGAKKDELNLTER